MADPTFMLIVSPNGAPMLLNLDQTFAFTKDPAGLAVAVSQNGYVMALGVKFDVVQADFVGEVDQPNGAGAHAPK